MAGDFVFYMQRVNKFYGTKQVLKDINLSFYQGAKIGIVGENGSGKSTVLRIMAGVDKDFQGEAHLEKNRRVGFVQQEPRLNPEKDVRGNIEEAFGPLKALLKEFDEVSAKLGEPLSDEEMERTMNRMGTLQDKIDAADGWNLDALVDQAADALVLPPDTMEVEKLSGGERRRVALCKALLEKPDLLLLDEPTNHLDAETIEWLEAQLREYPGTVIIVTHDRYFLDRITKWILELDAGRGIPHEGNYSAWLAKKLEAIARSEKKETERSRSLAREIKWLKMSEGEKHDLTRARVSDYERLLAQEKRDGDDPNILEIPSGSRLGEFVLEFKNVTKGYGGDPLIQDLSFNLPRGAVVGVVGPNGAGKTTLFRMIAGEEAPDSGEVRKGAGLEMAYVDQNRDALDGEKTVYDEISEGLEEMRLGSRTVPARSYVGRFNFKGTDQQKLVKNLSGGERNRLHLAKLIKRGGNFLMLDEPTNDLDVGALRTLEDAINAFPGCALVISHDRFFLDRVCTHLLVFEGNGKVRWFEGNFQDYERMRRSELGDKALLNRRSKYRRLNL